MELKDLPIETLDLIIGHLFEFADEYDEGCDDPNPEHLANARLVSRQWNDLASRHLFAKIRLRHGSEGFEKWNAMLDNDMVKLSAREVRIESTPLEEDRDDEFDWDLWNDEGEYPEFTDSLDRIKELKNLTSLLLQFVRVCRTGEYEYDQEEEAEPISTRKRTLDAVFDAITKRTNESPDATVIRSLTVENLQNVVLDEFTASDNFQQVLQNLTRLHLVVADEHNTLDGEVERDLFRPERQNFEPHLRRVWLDPIAHQLTSLSLIFQCGWGVMPGKFDTSDLNFPQLKVLHLGSYIIAHHGQFDWVLRQKGLQVLRLDQCYIASHIRIGGGHRQLWDVPDTDWVKHPRGAFAFNNEDDEIYTFEGTWENVFDSIRESLPNLLDFRFSRCPHAFYLYRPDLMGNDDARLPCYAVFDTGFCGGWDFPDYNMTFGNNNPEPIDGDPTPATYRNMPKLDRGEETSEGDQRALDALVEATRRNGLC